MDPGSIPHKEDQLITVRIAYGSILERVNRLINLLQNCWDPPIGGKSESTLELTQDGTNVVIHYGKITGCPLNNLASCIQGTT